MSAIFSTGSNPEYDETTIEEYLEQLNNGERTIEIRYRGQLSGRDDYMITIGTLFFIRKKQHHLLTFGGIIIDVTCTEPKTDISPAIYTLLLSTMPINGVHCGAVMQRVDPELLSSQYAIKESALIRLGFKFVNRSGCSGINRITEI